MYNWDDMTYAVRNDSTLTLEMLKSAVAHIKSSAYVEPVIVIHKGTLDWFMYIMNTVTLLEVGNYRRCKGPDGKVWVERHTKMRKEAIGARIYPRTVEVSYSETRVAYNRHQRRHGLKNE